MQAPPASHDLARLLHVEPRPVRSRPETARPRLRCDVPSRLNPHADQARAHSLRWAVEIGLLPADGPAFARLTKARFERLAARSYPTVDAAQLCLVADWLTFLFAYDDECDTDDVNDPAHARHISEVEDQLVAIGHGQRPRPDESALGRAFADILRRVAAWGGPAWRARLGRHFEEYVHGCRWERCFRARRRMPNLASYARLRLLVSAVDPCLDLAGLFIDGHDPSFAEDVLVRQLEVMANNHISWVNDVHGLDKEIDERTPSNLVLVLAHQHGLAQDEAIDRAIEMCNAEAEAFLELAADLQAAGDPRRNAYIDALAAWMRGNFDWYGETRRYLTEREPGPVAAAAAQRCAS